MSVLAWAIIDKVARALVDVESIRWTRAELLDHLNDALKTIVVFVPTANAVRQDHALVTGTAQALPDGAQLLIDVQGNKDGDAITLISKDDLIAVRPGWRTEPRTTKILHYLYDTRTPKLFDVYPPAEAGSIIEIEVSKSPVRVAGDVDVITLADEYESAIYEYMLYRAYSKDETNQAYANMSATHMTLFLEHLGYKAKNELRFNPNTFTLNEQEGS